MEKRVKKSIVLLLVAVLLCASFTGCKDKEETLKDGYYSAEMSDYVEGWKEFVSICVSNGQLVTVEYNAKNASGFIKSWDMDYMRLMESITGTYPNLYTRTYAAELLESGDPDDIDAVTGASTSWKTFKQLASAVLDQAKKGDSSKVIVKSEAGDE